MSAPAVVSGAKGLRLVPASTCGLSAWLARARGQTERGLVSTRRYGLGQEFRGRSGLQPPLAGHRKPQTATAPHQPSPIPDVGPRSSLCV